jgi:hypothetical protein
VELFFILLLLGFISPIAIKTYNHAVPELKSQYRTRRSLGQIRNSQLALQREEKAHKEKLAKSHANHILELKSFDDSIKEIEGPALRTMVERRVIESSTAHMPTDRDFWLNEKHLLQQDFSHIHALCEGNEVTETDVALLKAIADRMDIVRKHLDRIDAEEEKEKWKRLQKERHEEKLEKERLKAPKELFDFLEVVNDPDSGVGQQMKALKTFVGDDMGSIEDVYYGRYTPEQLLALAEKKVERLQSIPNFDELMGAEGLQRLTNSDNPDRLMELWGIGENFNKWVSYVD